jgi:hypothetical protein
MIYRDFSLPTSGLCATVNCAGRCRHLYICRGQDKICRLLQGVQEYISLLSVASCSDQTLFFQRLLGLLVLLYFILKWIRITLYAVLLCNSLLGVFLLALFTTCFDHHIRSSSGEYRSLVLVTLIANIYMLCANCTVVYIKIVLFAVGLVIFARLFLPILSACCFPTFQDSLSSSRDTTPEPLKQPMRNLLIYKLTYYCRIWGSHTGGYEELYLIGYNAV